MVSLKVLGGLAALFVSFVSALPADAESNGGSKHPSWRTFTNVTIFSPTADYTTPQVLYARTAMIGDTILATWENYSPEPPLVYSPIFQSKDGGLTWKHIANVTDTQNGWGLRYQPMLYVLPRAIGKYQAGTVLLAVNSIPTDLSHTKIDVYASCDKGYNWEFVSHVAEGGRAEPTNGIPAIWEPFLMIYKNELILYYSDQRDPSYGQKLIHTTTTDLLTWSADVNDVTYPVYTARPGMTTVTKLPNGKYMMTYEYGGGPNADNSTTYRFPVYYRINSDPRAFDSSEGLPLISTDGVQPTGSPYITWSPVGGGGGGGNGTIIVSSGDRSEIFTNTKLGDVDSWVRVQTPSPNAYTRSLRVLPDPSKLLITGAGTLPPSENWAVRADVVSIV